jgi:hypothetical protein
MMQIQTWYCHHGSGKALHETIQFIFYLVVKDAREERPHLAPRVVFQLAVQGWEQHAPQAGAVELGFGFRRALHAAGRGAAHL